MAPITPVQANSMQFHFPFSRCSQVGTLFLLLTLAAMTVRADVGTGPQLQIGIDGVARDAVAFAELAQLPRNEYTTSTVWTEGVKTFSGVLMWDLLAYLGIAPEAWRGHVTLSAIDGYVVRLDADKVTPSAPMLAMLKNDRPMPRRERGPFWLVFPYDSDSVYRTETKLSLSIWQVEQLSIAP